jgi:hypothetical protein
MVTEGINDITIDIRYELRLNSKIFQAYSISCGWRQGIKDIARLGAYLLLCSAFYNNWRTLKLILVHEIVTGGLIFFEMSDLLKEYEE